MKYIVGHKNPDTDAICSALVYSQYLQDIGVAAQPVILGQANNETKYVLESAGVVLPDFVEELPDGAEIILVDHNELGQSIDDRERYKVTGVIDHHKVANFETSGPVMMRLEQVGSTCTVLAMMFAEKSYHPSSTYARLMISAIISDTLYFRSPTTTELDKQMVQDLNDIAQISDLEAYSLEMFDAKSDISKLSAYGILTMDYKEFEFDGEKIGIGAVETTNIVYAMDKKAEILEEMRKLTSDAGLSHVICCVIDILAEKNYTLVASHNTETVIIDIFDSPEIIDHVAHLGPRLSRKKQIVPMFAEYYTKT